MVYAAARRVEQLDPDTAQEYFESAQEAVEGSVDGEPFEEERCSSGRRRLNLLCRGGLLAQLRLLLQVPCSDPLALWIRLNFSDFKALQA